MGDRANVYVKEASVYLYTHWDGYTLAQTVRDALKRGKDRWTDSSYLARIVFCEMVKDDLAGTTGYGISSTIGDNGRPILVLDPREQTISVTEKGMDATHDDPVRATLPFSEFITLDDNQVRAWHLGTEYE